MLAFDDPEKVQAKVGPSDSDVDAMGGPHAVDRLVGRRLETERPEEGGDILLISSPWHGGPSIGRWRVHRSVSSGWRVGVLAVRLVCVHVPRGSERYPIRPRNLAMDVCSLDTLERDFKGFAVSQRPTSQEPAPRLPPLS